MQYTVLLSKQPDAPWRAVVPYLPDCVAEAATREEALARIKEHIAQIHQNFEIVQVEVPVGPLLNGNQQGQPEKTFEERYPYYGAFKDDPWLHELFDEIERQRDATLMRE